jgi:hypothetical protein
MSGSRGSRLSSPSIHPEFDAFCSIESLQDLMHGLSHCRGTIHCAHLLHSAG